MKLPHPAFFYHFIFRITSPGIQILIREIENNTLLWNGINSSLHPMGGKKISFQKNEIGHVHWNGDLDIVFGKILTIELLKLEIVQRHKYVPSVAVTFPLLKKEDIPMALSLLRFSYLKTLKNKEILSPETDIIIEAELAKLPPELKALLK